MFKGFNTKQQNGFTNLNFNGDYSAYGQSGCNFWLRADMGLNTTTNLGAVSRWVDIVSGVIFEQATAASQPRLLTSDAAYNNLPVIQDNDGVRSLVNQANQAIGVRSLAFVANYDTLLSRNALISAAGSAYEISLGGSGTGINGVTFRLATTPYTGTTESTSVKIVVISNGLLMVNGVVENTNSAINLDLGTIRTLFFVASQVSLFGKVAEIIGFSTSLNQDQALALSTQLNQKYVIY
jgi:hypothetical protein